MGLRGSRQKAVINETPETDKKVKRKKSKKGANGDTSIAESINKEGTEETKPVEAGAEGAKPEEPKKPDEAPQSDPAAAAGGDKKETPVETTAPPPAEPTKDAPKQPAPAPETKKEVKAEVVPEPKPTEAQAPAQPTPEPAKEEAVKAPETTSDVKKEAVVAAEIVAEPKPKEEPVEAPSSVPEPVPAPTPVVPEQVSAPVEAPPSVLEPVPSPVEAKVEPVSVPEPVPSPVEAPVTAPEPVITPVEAQVLAAEPSLIEKSEVPTSVVDSSIVTEKRETTTNAQPEAPPAAETKTEAAPAPKEEDAKPNDASGDAQQPTDPAVRPPEQAPVESSTLAQGDAPAAPKEVQTVQPNAAEVIPTAVNGMDKAPVVNGDVAQDQKQGLESIPYTFTWESGGKQVALSGSFNQWADPVPLAEKSGIFSVNVKLAEGEHHYKYQVDGNWVTNNTQPITELEGHGQVNVAVVKPGTEE